MSIREVLESTKRHLRDVRNAIMWRGGQVDTLAGMKDLPNAICSIPSDAALTTVCQTVATDVTVVPDRSTGIACLTAFGGLSVRDSERNEIAAHRLRGLRSLSDGEELGSFTVPEAILSLEGYGDGIDLTCYNEVNTVERKYIRRVVTRTFKGAAGERWTNGVTAGQKNNYYVTVIGDLGVYGNGDLICNRYDNTAVTSSTQTAGIDVYDSTARGGAALAIRPENVENVTVASFIESLKENPLTIKIALVEPIETDISDILPSPPIFPVKAGGYVEFSGDYLESGIPSPPTEVAYQCYTE